jgi:uncharacterized membrane protein
MTDHNPQSTAKIAGHPLHPMIIPFPVAAFVGTLLVDIAFLATDNVFWFTAGIWLLRFGLAMAALAAVLGLIDFLGESGIRSLNAAWLHFIGNVVVVAIEAFNLYLRASPASVSTAVYLSAVAVALLLFTGWKGWEMVYRHHVGIAEEPR